MIPNELFGLFKLADLKIKYHDDFVELGLTPTFIPPQARDYKAEFEAQLREVQERDRLRELDEAKIADSE